MSKLNIMPSPNPKESPATFRSPEGETQEGAAKRKRDFDVVDSQALYALYPQFFKLTPDFAKIRQAIKLGLELPGIEFHESPVGDGEQNAA